MIDCFERLLASAQKHWELPVGAFGIISTLTLERCIAIATGVTVLFIMIVKARKEYRHRND